MTQIKTIYFTVLHCVLIAALAVNYAYLYGHLSTTPPVDSDQQIAQRMDYDVTMMERP